MKNEFVGKCFVIRNKEGNFVYGECEGTGTDFEMAQKFNEWNDAERFINHNRQYDNDNWEIFRVHINYNILV